MFTIDSILSPKEVKSADIQQLPTPEAPGDKKSPLKVETPPSLPLPLLRLFQPSTMQNGFDPTILLRQSSFNSGNQTPFNFPTSSPMLFNSLGLSNGTDFASMAAGKNWKFSCFVGRTVHEGSLL